MFLWNPTQCQISKSKFQINVKYQMTKLSKSLDYDESCRHRIQYILSFCHLDFIWHLSFEVWSIPACPD